MYSSTLGFHKESSKILICKIKSPIQVFWIGNQVRFSSSISVLQSRFQSSNQREFSNCTRVFTVQNSHRFQSLVSSTQELKLFFHTNKIYQWDELCRQKEKGSKETCFPWFGGVQLVKKQSDFREPHITLGP